MRHVIRAASVFVMGTATVLSLTSGSVRAQDAETITVKIVLEAPGLTRNLAFDVGVFPFLRDPQTGEPKLQSITSDRMVLGPETTQLVKTYALKQGLQYQFTADLPTSSGDLPDFTYALAGDQEYRTIDLSKTRTVALTLVKTPRVAKNSGTFFDVSNLAGTWELAIYTGANLLAATH